MRLIVPSLLTLLSVLPLMAAEYLVAPGGDDANAGTLVKPFQTVGRAAALLQPGGTCWLRAGVYRETARPANSGDAGKPTRFAAYKGEAVTTSGGRSQPHGQTFVSDDAQGGQ